MALKSIRITPSATIGNASWLMLNFTPRKATSQAVLVDPRLAPKMIPMDCAKVISPAFTKPMVMMEVEVDDWVMLVTIVPVMMEEIGRLVNRSIRFRSALPEAAFKPSAINIMPRRKKLIPPITFMTDVISYSAFRLK